ncbi:response regulator [Saccharothrix algeriensis]|uniref:CheY-like chemotaxis protein n=1 Tax=Saccharothrix algeriensis TaxID=173560 RepID=A0A8T8HTR6_9PSEU|nr:response regulator [Saccharothrix algeriensis]MBM7813435.1 CheY-like chemotaxis protein [Saccharothrix algeriensis]QTR01953.1 response regulator [Saccharothrix algeriensis]
MAEVISSVASLLWPLVVVIVLYGFRSQLRAVIGSAAKREVTLEVGGQVVTLGTLSEAQSDAIADLQKQLGELREQLGVPSRGPDPAPAAEEQTSPPAVLWVDDNPENNVLEIARLRDRGVRVDLARSTREAVPLVGGGRYRAVVTDMVRREHGREVADAGLRLADAVRALDPAVPIAIYTGFSHRWAATDTAVLDVASLVTASPWELSEFFRKLDLL